MRPENEPLIGLYRRQHRRLVNYLRKVLGSGPPDPEDIAQAAFAKLAEREDLSGIENLSAFLWRTAQNLVTSEHRAAVVQAKRQREVSELFFPGGADDFHPERVLISREELDRVSEVVAKMNPRRREVLKMSRLDGLSAAEIARRLGLARSTVAEHLARALLELNEHLQVDDRV